MRKGHQVTFAQPTNVTYAREETRPPDSEPLEPEPAVSRQAGPGPSVANGHRRVLLSPEPESAKAARDFTMATLQGWDLDDVIAEAVLVATELVTNAIRHGGCCAVAEPAPGMQVNGQVELAWQRDASRVICVVTDGSANPPVLVPADPDSECGRGLQVVQALASSWGWMMLGATQKAVWAALHLAPGSLSGLQCRLPARVFAVTGPVTASVPEVNGRSAGRLGPRSRDGPGTGSAG